jgi:nitrogen regulatory protein P-II 1
MKRISSIVRLDKVDAVKAALARLNVVGLTVGEVQDHAPQQHETTVWRGREYNLGFSSKMQLDVVVHEDDVDDVVGAIIRTARTGVCGDGYVTVSPVEHRYSIYTGEREAS